MGAYTAITYSVDERICTIALNRPDARNGYTHTMARELASAFAQANADEDVQVVVLAGNGEHFCVGMDMAGGDEPDDFTDPNWVEPASRAVRPLWRLDKPVIAAVHGAAVGVGATMILAADVRIAADDARFGFVFSRRGLFPEGGSTWFLPRIVGLGRATEWMVTGRVFPATEALSAGLVTQLVPRAELLDTAYDIAREIVKHTAPVSVGVIRRTLAHMAGEPSPEASFELDSRLIAHAFGSMDSVEGMVSFMTKRDPQFPGQVSKDLPPFLPWVDDDNH